MQEDINKVKYLFEFITTLNRLVGDLKRTDYSMMGGDIVAKDLRMSFVSDWITLSDATKINPKTEKSTRVYGNAKIKQLQSIIDDINKLKMSFNVENVKTIYKLKKHLVAYEITDNQLIFHTEIEEEKGTIVLGREFDQTITLNPILLRKKLDSKELSQADINGLNRVNVSTFSFKHGEGQFNAMYPYSELLVKDKLSAYQNVSLMLMDEYTEWSFDLITLQHVAKPLTIFTVESSISYVRFDI